MTALERRILEVATWILKVNPQLEHNYFRSEEINSLWGNNASIKNKYPLVSADGVVETAKRRALLLQERGIPLVSLEEAAGYGNLVYTLPEESHLDGGAEFYSQGLVDIWEVPAWDTWVAFGNHEFKEFNLYPSAVISWIPRTINNLFFSGREVSIIENLGWLDLNTNNQFLSSLTGQPENLVFIDIADEDKGAMSLRLQLINGWGVESEKKVEANEEVSDAIVKPVAGGLLNTIKNWFK
ncbi:hypothetical protein [Hymenobacter sp. BT559]|uniref:hypothetical protein n=1 Tax=Hymenobacter sp. BT559 TaxID=2795729 RepID=UPI0018EDE34A|nr:hypothetical protein [Hymenobacter sp. BT559]MBJ6142991.1 hypothetical protein [Hymenobacter sp. BT559]